MNCIIGHSLVCMIVCLFAGCDQWTGPTAPTPAPVTTTEDETLEAFMLRVVRSVELVRYVDRDRPRDFVTEYGLEEEFKPLEPKEPGVMSKEGPVPLTFDWTFGKENFTITASEGNLPEPLMLMLLGHTFPAQQVRGKWELSESNGDNSLMLTSFRTDTGATSTYRRLNLFHTAPEVLYISGDTGAELRFRVHAREKP